MGRSLNHFTACLMHVEHALVNFPNCYRAWNQIVKFTE